MREDNSSLPVGGMASPDEVYDEVFSLEKKDPQDTVWCPLIRRKAGKPGEAGV